MNIEQIILFISALLTAISICVTYFLSMKEIRNTTKLAIEQNKRSIYAEYTKRYQDIILAMPDNVFNGTEEVNSITLKYTQLYFDLCSEEYYLYRAGQIPKDIWNNWKEGMILTTKLTLFRLCWKHQAQLYNPDFYNFFDNNIINIQQYEKENH